MGQVDTVDMTRPLELSLAQVIAKAISRALPSRKVSFGRPLELSGSDIVTSVRPLDTELAIGE